MPEFYRSSVEWNPSAVVALATSADGLRVAAARSDGSVEIWLVSPGSIGWHCQLVRHGPKTLLQLMNKFKTLTLLQKKV